MYGVVVTAAALCLCPSPASPATLTNSDPALLAQLGRADTMFIEVLSRRDVCQVKVDGRTALYRQRDNSAAESQHDMMKHIGMYAVSVHPGTGRVTGEAFAPGYMANAAYAAMEDFVSHVTPGRLLVFCVLAEGAVSLDTRALELFRTLNSSFVPDMQIHSMFALVVEKNGPVYGEGYSLNLDAMYPGNNGTILRLAVRVPRTSEAGDCVRGPRASFCSRHDGYAGLCDCGDAPWPPPRPEPRGALFPFPVVIVASNRPRYLVRCLGSLLPNRGLDPQKVVVFADGDYPAVREVTRLLGVRLYQHVVEGPILRSHDAGARIGLIYRTTMEAAFNMFPDADKIVLLEEDLEVSPDFISFFNQTSHLLDIDPSLYCISAWNDHGYNHSVGDPAQLYRVGFLPGLGWMLKRSLFFEELLPAWPEPWSDYDWDVLLRYAEYRKSRDCVIPDVPRTYHFGFIGQHVEATMQFKYYVDHALNTIPDVTLKDVDNMVYHRYEDLLMKGIRTAVKIDGRSYGNSERCDSVLPDRPMNQSYVMFIRMVGPQDTGVWEKVATCLNLWDLDVRGDHRGVWRFYYNSNPIFVVGVPYAEIASVSINLQGEVVIFGGERTARSKKLGRWPPGLPRATPAKSRMRLAVAVFKAAEGGDGEDGNSMMPADVVALPAAA